MTEEDWNAMTQDPTSGVYYPANISYDGDAWINDVGVRIKGSSSLRGAQQGGDDRYSLKIKANEYVSGQKIRDEKKLNFNNGYKDPSFMHETLSYGIMRQFIPSSQTAYGDIFMNDLHLGLYTVVEQVDTIFLGEYFNFTSGDLYRVGPPDGYCEYQGDSLDDYTDTELKTNEDTSTGAALINMLDVLNYQINQVGTVMNVTEVLYHLASQISFVNLDSAAGDGNNMYWYQSQDNDALPVMALIPWDQNEAFGTFGCVGGGGGGPPNGPPDAEVHPHAGGPPNAGLHANGHFHRPRQGGPPPPNQDNLTTLDVYTPCNSTQSVLFANLVPNNMVEYNSALDAVVNGPMSPDVMDAQITAISDMIRPYVYKDTTKFGTNDQFECSVYSSADPQRPKDCGT
eukprot:CAMPEP_0201487110 /NCGR_PEP_ID=MMETSP0151_2-20130828/11108_1 /ASSEMBLY_ACC=CAM_ASM_000257 /TAXON_ID=200890 /ORGANISM="Paramoeba atlantica, Strain 621/1 / CCAP 1560/9" /LENGTH=398 /DNA_ID=CAMNT_0047872063 /DNA_START=190 /DNA_END=1383 /DNA_ORIENTATION=-